MVVEQEDEWEHITWEYDRFFLTPTFRMLCLLLTVAMLFGLVLLVESFLLDYGNPAITTAQWQSFFYLFATYGLAFGVVVYIYKTLEDVEDA